MNNTKLTADSIKRLLNHSVNEMDETTIENLRTARTRALEGYRAQQNAPVLAWLNHHGLMIGSSSGSHKTLYWALALIFAACLLSGASYWQHSYEHDHSEIDIAILTDDLPVDAYVE